MAKLDSLVIVRRVNGQLELDLTNLDKILEAINLNSDVPLAILSFVGESGAGKSFYTNLLIQNLQNGSTGGWLSQISDDNRSGCSQLLPGFPSGKEEGDDGNVVATSEICLWAEAFLLENHGKKFAVLVLHANFKEADEKQETMDSLEVFLALVSSRIVEIQWRKEEFRLLDIFQRFLEKDETVFESVLRNSSFVYLFRTKQKLSKGNTIVGKQGVDHLKKLVKKSKSNEIEMDYLENVNIVYVEDRKGSLLNTKGSLSLSTEMYNNLYAVVNLIADDEEIFPKSFTANGEDLTMGKLKEFMQACVKLINDMLGSGQRKEVDVNCEIQIASPIASNANADLPVKEVKESSPTACTAPDKGAKGKTSKCDASEVKKHAVQRHQKKEASHEHLKQTKNEVKTTTRHITPVAAQQQVQFVTKQVVEHVLKQLKNWKPDADGGAPATTLPDLSKTLEERFNIVINPGFVKAYGLKEDDRQMLLKSSSSSDNVNNLRQELANIQNLLQSFQSQMSANEGSEHFPKLLADMEMKAKATLKHETSVEYTMRVSNWLISRNRSFQINQNPSSEILSMCLEQIQKFYEEEMERVLKDGPYTVEKLLQIHSCITNRCVLAFATAAELPMNPLILLEKLNKQFSLVKKASRKLLQGLQKKVNNLVAKAKEKYDLNEGLNNALNISKLQRNKAALCQRAHEQARAEAVRFLEERIREGGIREGEPVAGHRRTLIGVIDSDWEELLPQYI